MSTASWETFKPKPLQKALDEAVGKAWLGNRPEPTGTNAAGEQNRTTIATEIAIGDRGDRRARSG